MFCFILDNSTQTADVFVENESWFELTPCKLLSRCNETLKFLPTTLSNSSAIGFNLIWSSRWMVIFETCKL